MTNPQQIGNTANGQINSVLNSGDIPGDLRGQMESQLRAKLGQAPVLADYFSSGKKGDGSLMPQSYTPYDMKAFENSPEYQIMQNQTQNAVDAAGNQSSMTGGANSNNMKSLMGWTQGNALQGYSSGLNDYMSQFLQGNQAKAQQFNTLSGVAGMGQNAAANLGGFSTQVGGQIGQNMIGAGNANAAGTVGISNAMTSGIGQGYNQWLQSQYLQNAPGNYSQSYDMGGGTGNISYSVPP